jgi:hypothetical protein
MRRKSMHCLYWASVPPPSPPSTLHSPHSCNVSRAYTMAMSAALAFLHASILCQLSGGPDRGALGTRIDSSEEEERKQPSTGT